VNGDAGAEGLNVTHGCCGGAAAPSHRTGRQRGADRTRNFTTRKRRGAAIRRAWKTVVRNLGA